MKKSEKGDNNLDNSVENESKTFEEMGTETEIKYDRYEPVPCLNYGYH